MQPRIKQVALRTAIELGLGTREVLLSYQVSRADATVICFFRLCFDSSLPPLLFLT